MRQADAGDGGDGSCFAPVERALGFVHSGGLREGGWLVAGGGQVVIDQ